MRTSLYSVFIITIFILVCMGGCEDKESDNKIKIGIILPLSGEVETYGKAVRRGLDIALQENKKFEFIYEDSKADERTAINALQKLLLSNIKYYIGDATSSVTYEIGPRIQNENGILIVPIATGDKIRDIGNNVFMISPRNEKQTKKIASFIMENYSNKYIGCFFKQNDYGVNIANTFVELFYEKVYTQAYQDGQIDFRSSLENFRQKNVDLIFLPGNYQENATILRQSKEINYNPIFIGTDGAYSPKLISLAGEASEGFMLTMMPVNEETEFYKLFEEKYRNMYNNSPDIFACYGYESGTIMMNAIINNINSSTEKICEYIRATEFNSLTGKLKFDSKGEAQRDYKIYIVKDGTFVSYK